MQWLTSAWSEVSETTIKNCLRNVGILEKLAEETTNDQDDPFKELWAEELEENINEFHERLPDAVPEELNAAVLLDIDAELSTNGDKLSDAEILAEVREEAIQEEDDIDAVYDEPPAPSWAFKLEKYLREILSKENIYSQRAIAKERNKKLSKTTLNFDFLKWCIFVLHIMHNVDSFWCIFCFFTCFIYTSLRVNTIRSVKYTPTSRNHAKLKF